MTSSLRNRLTARVLHAEPDSGGSTPGPEHSSRSTLRISQPDGAAPPRPCLLGVPVSRSGRRRGVPLSVTPPSTSRLLRLRSFCRRPTPPRSFVEDSMAAPKPNSLDGWRRRRLRLLPVADTPDSDVRNDRLACFPVLYDNAIHPSDTSHINHRALYGISRSLRNTASTDG